MIFGGTLAQRNFIRVHFADNTVLTSNDDAMLKMASKSHFEKYLLVCSWEDSGGGVKRETESLKIDATDANRSSHVNGAVHTSE